MSVFKTFVDSAVENWNDTAPAARVGLVLLLALCVTAVAGVGYWSSQPTYVTLISNVGPEKMDRVIDALDKASISYDLSGAGGNLRVSKSDFSKARLLARSAGVAQSMTGDLGMGVAFGSPADRQRVALQRKQLALAETIRKLNAVEQVDVHLNVPDKGPFERQSSSPTASVLLTLAPGARLSDEQGSSIASLVAFAIEDLEPEAVQIADKEGRNYTVTEKRMQRIASQIEYTTESEKKLARKAETQLVHFLGHGNASVQVSLDLTFTNGSKTITKYDSDGKVANEEDLNTEITTGSKLESPGAGIEANLGADGQRGSKSVESTLENIKTTYLVPKVEETQSNTTPIRNFMTVSVLVNSESPGIKKQDGSLLDGISDRVKAIVENAVGYQSSKDTISVELLPFPKLPAAEEEFVPPYDWSQWTEIVRNASLAIAAIVAFFIGFLTLRKIKPAPTQVETVVRLDDERTQSLRQMGELFKDNPEIFAQIVQSWSELNSDQLDQSEKKRAA